MSSSRATCGSHTCSIGSFPAVLESHVYCHYMCRIYLSCFGNLLLSSRRNWEPAYINRLRDVLYSFHLLDLVGVETVECAKLLDRVVHQGGRYAISLIGVSVCDSQWCVCFGHVKYMYHCHWSWNTTFVHSIRFVTLSIGGYFARSCFRRDILRSTCVGDVLGCPLLHVVLQGWLHLIESNKSPPNVMYAAS